MTHPALTVPVAIFVLGVWALILRHRLTGFARVAILVAAIAIAARAFLPFAPACAALVVVVIVVLIEYSGLRESADHQG